MSNTVEGRIIVNFGRHMTVETTTGKRVECRIKGRSLRPVCGDLVSVESSPDSTGLITSIHKRDSLLVRHDPRLGQQPLAANVDRMIVVVAPKPTLDPAMIDRYLAAAAILGIPALILLNKIDLLDTTRIVACREALDEYAAIGYSILETSAASGKGIDIGWSRSGDEGGGENDVLKYVVWRRTPPATDWGDPLLAIPSGQTSYTYADQTTTSGVIYQYAVAAQDCTPNLSGQNVSPSVTAP